MLLKWLVDHSECLKDLRETQFPAGGISERVPKPRHDNTVKQNYLYKIYMYYAGCSRFP